MWALVENKTAQGISAWIGIVGAGFTVLTKLTPEWFGTLTWSQSLLLGLGLTVAAMFFTTASLALYRLFRPLPASLPVLPTLDHPPQAQTGLTLVDVEAAFDDRMKSLHQAISDVVGMFVERDEKVENMASLQSRALSKFEERADAIEADLATRKAEADNHHIRITELLTLLRKIIDDYQRMSAFEADTRVKLKALEESADKTRHSLHAIYTREILTKVASDIERDAAELYDGLHSGQVYDEERWNKWEEAHARWESALSVWVQNGHWFSFDVETRIYRIDDSLYSKKWSEKDTQFPESETLSRSEAVRRFKKFRIIHIQWRQVREDVDRGVIQVAYVGLSDKDVRQRPPKVQT